METEKSPSDAAPRASGAGPSCSRDTRSISSISHEASRCVAWCFWQMSMAPTIQDRPIRFITGRTSCSASATAPGLAS
jgi:hypothetical protein